MGEALNRYITSIRLQSVGTSQSQASYVRNVRRFLEWYGRTDDDLIGEVRNAGTLEERERVLKEHVHLIEKWGVELLEKKRARSTVNVYFTSLKDFYEANDFKLPLKSLRRTHTEIRDHAPTPQELQQMIECADSPRSRFIIAALALSGFRVGTLLHLRYRHVKKDLESGLVPIHVHVEREITKGKIRDYDTFLGEEAVNYLRIYLNERKLGALRYDGAGMPPEVLTDESPLVRNAKSKRTKGVSTSQVWQVVHHAMIKAGLIEKVKDGDSGTWYSMRLHSLRKFFKTQMEAKGVPRDFAEYMMGHSLPGQDESYFRPTIEQLREWYVKANLRIRTETIPEDSIRRESWITMGQRDWGIPRQQLEQILNKHVQAESPTARTQSEIELIQTMLMPNKVPAETLASVTESLARGTEWTGIENHPRQEQEQFIREWVTREIARIEYTTRVEHHVARTEDVARKE